MTYIKDRNTREVEWAVAPVRQLAAGFGIFLSQLHDPDKLVVSWPAVVLHSPDLAWPFDADASLLDDVDDLLPAARHAGLHQVSDPFAPELPRATRDWVFKLSYPSALVSPDVAVSFGERRPNTSENWWCTSVERGGVCRLLIAVCAVFNPEPTAAAYVLDAVAADNRLFGATIPIDF